MTYVSMSRIGSASVRTPSPRYSGERVGERGPPLICDLKSATSDFEDPAPLPSPRSTGERECKRQRSPRVYVLAAIGLACVLACARNVGAAAPGDLRVEPTAVTLNHHGRPHSIVVTTTTADGLTVDLTSQARYESGNPAVVAVDGAGRLVPVGNGTARVTVSAADKSAGVDVVVTLPPAPPPV